MVSPLAEYASATLVWRIPTRDDFVYGYDGAPLVGYSNDHLLNYTVGTELDGITYVVMTAFLKVEKQNRYVNYGVSDSTQVGQKVGGYCVTPPLVDQLIQGEQQADATFWRVTPGQFTLPKSGFPSRIAYELFKERNKDLIAVEGYFIWEQNIPAPFGVEAILGDKLKGRFVNKGEWVADI